VSELYKCFHFRMEVCHYHRSVYDESSLQYFSGYLHTREVWDLIARAAVLL
jgi:hypothetical protein